MNTQGHDRRLVFRAISAVHSTSDGAPLLRSASPLPQETQRGEGRRAGATQGLVAVIDPLPLRRAAVTSLLRASAYELEPLECTNAAELIECTDGARANLVVLCLGGRSVGDAQIRETIELLQVTIPEAPIVVLSDNGSVEDIALAVRLGIRGYLPASLEAEEALQALRFVRAGGRYLPPEAFVAMLDERPTPLEPPPALPAAALPRLTPRQHEVLDRLRQGKSNKVIAHELQTQLTTVKVHVRNIMKKLGATNRTMAALLAERLCTDEGGSERV